MTKLILVGRVAGAFGVKGEVRVTAYTADPAALLAFRDLKGKDGAPALTLLSGRVQKGEVIGRAKEIATKEEADALRGLLLHVPREALPEPDEDEYYLTDLIGMAAVTPEGETVGRVKAVQDFGAGDILEIAPPKRPSMLIPFTRASVPDIDLSAGRLTAVPPVETEVEVPEEET